MTHPMNRSPQSPRLKIHGGFARTISQPDERMRDGAARVKSGVESASEGRNIGRMRVSLLDVAEFANEFRALVGAGLPLGEGLGIISRSMARRSPGLSSALADVRGRVEQGKCLGEAFGAHRAVMGDLAVEMIAAGEQTGRLDQYLGEIATVYEERHKNRATVLSALIEPALIICVGIGVVYLILTMTVPRMRELYDSIAQETVLPLPTRVLIGMADFLTSAPGLLLALVAIATPVAFAFALRGSAGLRYWVDAALLRLPLLADMIGKDSIGRGCRTLAVSLRTIGDVPLGLGLAARTAGNRRIGAAFNAAAESVRTGRSIATSMEETGLFPEVCLWMVRTGERSGTLDTMLDKVADTFESQVRFARERMLTILRPILVVVMGLLVLLIMLALYLPMFRLIENLRQ